METFSVMNSMLRFVLAISLRLNQFNLNYSIETSLCVRAETILRFELRISLYTLKANFRKKWMDRFAMRVSLFHKDTKTIIWKFHYKISYIFYLINIICPFAKDTGVWSKQHLWVQDLHLLPLLVLYQKTLIFTSSLSHSVRQPNHRSFQNP